MTKMYKTKRNDFNGDDFRQDYDSKENRECINNVHNHNNIVRYLHSFGIRAVDYEHCPYSGDVST